MHYSSDEDEDDESHRVSLPMASCVRLARVLACKLDAFGGLS